MQHPTIIFQNDSLFVINKPYGMVVNKADTTKAMYTVQDWVEEHMFDSYTNGMELDKEGDFYKRAGIVHRIDKETSGALLIAKNERSFLALQAQFKEKTINKTYIALCHGHIKPESGVIDVPIGRLPWNRRKFGVIPDGRASVTRYSLQKIYKTPKKEELSLVECYPETGRTHQIRVHMRHLGFPIFGDELYAGRKNSQRDRKQLARHFLHAHKIIFSDPDTNSSISVECELSTELIDFINTLS
jgi:23S rRNA pseudouridine1911/1915/1917 synthase